MTVTVDISEQVSVVRRRVRRAVQAILDRLPDAESVVRSLEQSSNPTDRMVAEYYRKLEQEQDTNRHIAVNLLDMPITVSSPWSFTQEQTMKKIKITHAGGRPCEGSITDAETGVPIERVSRVEIVLDASDAAARAVLYIENVALDFSGDATCVSTIRYDAEDTESIDQAIGVLQAERERRMRQ